MEIKLCECGCGEPAPIAIKTDARRGHVKDQPIRFINHHQNVANHGMSNTPEYAAWSHAQQRCTNPTNEEYKNYGARGIKFLFVSFEQFFNELGPRTTPQHSLDRINNDGNYEPGNVRWATDAQQRANKRHPGFSPQARLRRWPVAA